MSEHFIAVELNEASFNTLQRGGQNGVPGTADRKSNSDRVQIYNLTYIPAPADASLTIKAKAKTKNASVYDVVVKFDSNVNYVEKDNMPNVSFIAVDGKDYFIRAPFAHKTNIKVKCSCLDFYYRFSVWNDQKNALVEPGPEPYRKKTDRPPVNPNKVAGVCKHLMKFIEVLKVEGVINP